MLYFVLSLVLRSYLMQKRGAMIDGWDWLRICRSCGSTPDLFAQTLSPNVQDGSVRK